MSAKRIRQAGCMPRRAFLYMGAYPLWSWAKVSAHQIQAAPWYVDQAPVLQANGTNDSGRKRPSQNRLEDFSDGEQRLTHWTRQAIRLIVKYQQNPLRAARALSYLHVAMHDAWLHAARLAPTAVAAAPELAAHRAASLLMEQLYPNETPGQFEAQYALLRPHKVQTANEAQAAAIGQWVAASLIDRSLRDGAGRTWPIKQRPAAFEGIWQPTYPLYAANPVEGYAAQWRPWVARGPARYEPPTPPRPGDARHAQETLEVLEVSRALTEHQKQTAQQWNLDAGSVTPAGVWMQQTLDELKQGTRPMLAVLAAVSVALHDAFVECWRIKLRDWSERPVTAIRRGLDSGFVPLLVTPGFPSYVSGHATASAAAAAVLAYFRPEGAARFHAMAEEAAMSRLWGGIHFRCDNEEGLRLGASVGQEIVAKRQAANPNQ